MLPGILAEIRISRLKKRKWPVQPAILVVGGAEEDRTPDLCIANAALSQLSYRPISGAILLNMADVRKRRLCSTQTDSPYTSRIIKSLNTNFTNKKAPAQGRGLGTDVLR